MESFDSFKKVTETDWRAKIDQDLKGKANSSDYVYHISEGIDVSPFTTEFKTKYEVDCKYPGKSKIGVYITKSSENKNIEILNLLSLGAEVLAIEVDEKSDISSILGGVFLDLIDLILITEGDILRIKYNLDAHVHTPGNSTPKTTTYLSKNNLELLDHEVYLAGEESFSERLLAFHRKVISNINSKNHNELVVKLTLKPDFYAQIGELRAMRKIFQYEVDKHGAKFDLNILTFIDESPINKEMHPMIGANYLLLSSKFGSADVSFGFSEDDNHDLVRLSLHAQNIYNLESNLDKVEDPWAGSYYLESITEAMIDFVLNPK